MAAEIQKRVVVSVTDGDAIETNRLKGKSNTGTYFLCSRKDWAKFSTFFNENETTYYSLNLKKIKSYMLCFEEMFFSKRNDYQDKMANFHDICLSLLSYDEPINVGFQLRINDTRVFLKFVDNNADIERNLRGIIYSSLTCLVFEKNNGSQSFFLEINF